MACDSSSPPTSGHPPAPSPNNRKNHRRRCRRVGSDSDYEYEGEAVGHRKPRCSRAHNDHPRRRKSNKQLLVLQDFFDNDIRPSKEEIHELAKQTLLNYKEVQRWFRNARHKNKKTRVAQHDIVPEVDLEQESELDGTTAEQEEQEEEQEQEQTKESPTKPRKRSRQTDSDPSVLESKTALLSRLSQTEALTVPQQLAALLGVRHPNPASQSFGDVLSLAVTPPYELLLSTDPYQFTSCRRLDGVAGSSNRPDFSWDMLCSQFIV